jgi:hypothetical protein
MSPPELVFLHIPKTAGTSQHSSFNQHYGAQNVFWIGRDCPPDVYRYPRKKVGERRLVGGHKPLSFYPQDFDPLYCAILRDPVERAISLFVYYTHPELAVADHERETRRDILQQLQKKGMDPRSMTRSIRNCRSFRQEISNYQCHYLSRGRATFAAVLKSLRKHDFVIGTVKSYDRFYTQLGELLGWADEPAAQVNRSRDNYATAFLDDEELVTLINKLNREDEKLVKWVESEHDGLWLELVDEKRKRRLGALPRKVNKRQVRPLTWEDARDLWPHRGHSKLAWPLSHILVAERHRLIYIPTPGPVNMGIQRLMLRLSSVEHKEALLQLGMERVLEEFATGLLLADRSAADIEAMASAADYFRFAIVYEPVARLINIYQQRFVAMRDLLPQSPRLHELVAAVQGKAVADCEAGISFRQFVSAIVSGDHRHQLWQLQGRYLPWPDVYDRFYRPDQLPVLESDLARITGLPVRIEPKVVRAGAACAIGDVQFENASYADAPAGELPAEPALWRNQLVDESIYNMIWNYYEQDFKLYNRSKDNELEVTGA